MRFRVTSAGVVKEIPSLAVQGLFEAVLRAIERDEVHGIRHASDAAEIAVGLLSSRGADPVSALNRVWEDRSMLNLLLTIVMLAAPRDGGTLKQLGLPPENFDLGPSDKAKPPKYRTRVTVEPARVDGGAVDERALDRFVRARAQALNACYQKQLEVRPELKGAVKANFEITPLGRTNNIQLATPEAVGGPVLQRCLTAVLASWLFPFKPLAAHR